MGHRHQHPRGVGQLEWGGGQLLCAKIIRSRSTQCLSFPLTVATFLASTCWTLYGLLLGDLYITVPNVPGIVTSAVRFWLFRRYPPDRDRPYKPLHA
uniref:Sugar transporter SWEET1 n=1 Tax=Sphenodon punctatus TaxID=8508 RepID=A0A8D0GG72_SPHPU